MAIPVALCAYQLSVIPETRRELRLWSERAAAIPDPVLRELAGASLRDKGRNAEATAALAILAPRRNRRPALRAMTAFQVAVDYLDTLGEQDAENPLAYGLALHGALAAAVSPGGPVSDWYRLGPRREDGGYLQSLVSGCRSHLELLPGWGGSEQVARAAAERCAEGQSHTHAAAGQGSSALQAWAAQLQTPAGYTWWELAAGASSSVAVHALIAAAGHREATASGAAAIDAAYFPPIGALTVLLDDLVDLDEDAAAGEHNYMRYYANSATAADRLTWIAEQAQQATSGLRFSHRHNAILAGVAGFYLSSRPARSDYASPIRRRLLDSLGAPARIVAAAMRLRAHG